MGLFRMKREVSGKREKHQEYGDGARNLADRCGCSCSNRFVDGRGAEDRTSWKPEGPFMAGSFESPVRETSHTVHATGSL